MRTPWAGWVIAATLAPVAAAASEPSFRVSPWWNERVFSEKTSDGIRTLVNAPASTDAKRPTLLVLYATPNGNTAEETLGCVPTADAGGRFDIQHIAAQTRWWRARDKSRNIVLAVVQPESKSWPAWRAKTPDANAKIRARVESLRAAIAPDARVSLAAHSGGGSFLLGFIEAGGAIPDWVERIAFLDANYSWSNNLHLARTLGWLKRGADRRLIALAYDDRNITLNGKPVISPTGGTYRATQRMREGLSSALELRQRRNGDILSWAANDGRLWLAVDANPENRILHTVLVETNGFFTAMTFGTSLEKDARWRGPRAYGAWIQPWEPDAPVATRPGPFPARPVGAPAGSALMESAVALSPGDREAAWEREILRGNVPDALRRFQIIETCSVDAKGRRHTARFAVAPDVLAIGADDDFARVPLTPETAWRVAGALGCVLPTRRLSDAIHRAADAKLEPRPLTEDREAVATFARHNAIIEQQLSARAARLVAGHKKDVVYTERLTDDRHVAIYGWHYTDGTPIQPLYTKHLASYVDYSHGIRLVAREVMVDGRPMDYHDILRDPDLRGLASDEPMPDRARR